MEVNRHMFTVQWACNPVSSSVCVFLINRVHLVPKPGAVSPRKGEWSGWTKVELPCKSVIPLSRVEKPWWRDCYARSRVRTAACITVMEPTIKLSQFWTNADRPKYAKWQQGNDCPPLPAIIDQLHINPLPIRTLNWS